MSRKTREILLARGYTETDLASEPYLSLLKDSKFCAAIDTEAAELQSAYDKALAEQQRLNGLLDEDEAWYRDKISPALQKAATDLADAEGRAAATEARLKSLQASGLDRVAAQNDPNAAATSGEPTVMPTAAASGATPKTNFLTPEEFDTRINSLGHQWGSATTTSQAMMQDILDEHRELFGTRIPGGASALAQEWQSARQTKRYAGSLKDFWEDKFSVPSKRTEVTKAAEEKRINDEVEKRYQARVSEMGNPMTRPMVRSNNPFTNRAGAVGGQKSGTTSGEGGSGRVLQPWDDPDRHNRRLAKGVSKFMSRENVQ